MFRRCRQQSAVHQILYIKDWLEDTIAEQKEVSEMDDVEEIISKISEESPCKRRPTQKRTWMTVPEMGKLLGLKKTDRYLSLIHI